MKAAEFEQQRKALQSKEEDLKQKGKGSKPNASVALTKEEIKLLYDKELLGTWIKFGPTTRSASVFVGVRSIGIYVGVTRNYSKLQMEKNF